ncbi:MAG TPA: serine hydrolase [Verrucomicrobiae bacterium]|nr:serine hydrolase [Verrucomicrobiae bacterium]
MNLRLIIITAVLATSAAPRAEHSLPRSTPEQQNVSSAKLLQYIEALDSQIEGMNSVIIVRHGKVIAEGWWTPYRAEDRHMLYSLSKSFTSTAVGLAQAEGKLSIDDTVSSFFPDLFPANPGANLKSIRVRDLLAMSTGHHNDDISKFEYASPDAVKRFLALPVAHKPGTHFVYNTPATFMLSAIVQKITGQPVLEYLQPRLFAPLGISDPTWESGKSGINMGGFGLSVRTEDIAKFGQLYLQNGEWRGEQLVPREWVSAASVRQTSNGSNPKSDWDQGYGYQFWRCRNGAFRGDGAFGQYCVVMPEEDAVLAITSGVKDMQKVLDVTWDYLLPALREKTSAHDKQAGKKLKEKLSSLKMPTPPAAPTSAQVNGKTYTFTENKEKLESLKIESANGTTLLNARVAGKDYRIPLASGKWSEPIRFAFAELPEQLVAASSGPDVAKIVFIESPYVLTLKITAQNDGTLAVDSEFNVGFGATRRPQLIGRP